MTPTLSRASPALRDRAQPVHARHAAGRPWTRLGFVQADPDPRRRRARRIWCCGTASPAIAPAISNGTTPARRRRGLLRQLRLHDAGRARADASARASSGAWPAPGKRTADAVLAFVRERGPGASARGRRALRPRRRHATTGAGRRARRRTCSITCTTAGLLRVSRPRAGIRLYAPRETPAPPVDAAARRAASGRARRSGRAPVCAGAGARRSAGSWRGCAWPRRSGGPSWRRTLARAKARSGPRPRGRRRLVLAGRGIAGRLVPAADPAPRCACSRRSIRSCGTGAASSTSGAGPTASRPTRRWPSAPRGYYAMPLLWRDRVIGWAQSGGGRTARCTPSLGYVSGRAPRERGVRCGRSRPNSRACAVFLGLTA